jgi:tetratricopeptide (TPR) repeat protein
MIALRFGSETYAMGHVGKAKAVFTDALNLFTISKNKRGIGACHNNLGAVEMSSGNFASALQHYQLAISNAEELLQENSDNEKLRCTLSDRTGNMAILRLVLYYTILYCTVYYMLYIVCSHCDVKSPSSL